MQFSVECSDMFDMQVHEILILWLEQYSKYPLNMCGVYLYYKTIMSLVCMYVGCHSNVINTVLFLPVEQM